MESKIDSKVAPPMNQTVKDKAKFGFLKPIHEVYNGDDSDECEEVVMPKEKEPSGF